MKVLSNLRRKHCSPCVHHLNTDPIPFTVTLSLMHFSLLCLYLSLGLSYNSRRRWYSEWQSCVPAATEESEEEPKLEQESQKKCTVTTEPSGNQILFCSSNLDTTSISESSQTLEGGDRKIKHSRLESCYVTHTNLEFNTFLPQPPESWSYWSTLIRQD
ncbi:phosducin isoform X3 [Rattus norvegicus]|nr:phosducin isoform X3 [Rattus norvegicus]